MFNKYKNAAKSRGLLLGRLLVKMLWQMLLARRPLPVSLTGGKLLQYGYVEQG